MYWLLYITIVGLVILSGCAKLPPLESGDEVFCGAEETIKGDGSIWFKTDSGYFMNGISQSDEYSFNGKYSSKLTTKKPYGIRYIFHDVAIGDRFRISGWRYTVAGTGNIGVKSEGAFYQEAIVTGETQDEWEKLEIILTVHNLGRDKEIDIHTWLLGEGEVYFDDLMIKRIHRESDSVKYTCTPSEDGIKQYAFLGHSYQWYLAEGDGIDWRLERLNKACFDQVWLGGDVCAETTKKQSTLSYLDSIFNLSDPTTYWALGNHDIRHGHLDWIENITGKNSFYAHYNNGFTAIVVNTNFIQKQQKDCQQSLRQLELIRNVCDTIRQSSHLILLFHHVVWMDTDEEAWTYSNEIRDYWRAECDSNATFGNVIYPELLKVQERGINVICIAGDAGASSPLSRHKKKFGYGKTDDGVVFLSSGINNSKYEPERRDTLPKDHILVLYHQPTEKKLTWRFLQLDSLLETQRERGLTN